MRIKVDSNTGMYGVDYCHDIPWSDIKIYLVRQNAAIKFRRIDGEDGSMTFLHIWESRWPQLRSLGTHESVNVEDRCNSSVWTDIILSAIELLALRYRRYRYGKFKSFYFLRIYILSIRYSRTLILLQNALHMHLQPKCHSVTYGMAP